MHKIPAPTHRHIIGMRVDVTSYDDVVWRVAAWAKSGESRSVCIANTHSAVESGDSEAFRHAVNTADLVTPDGMPLVWSLRRMGAPGASRVYGPDLMLHVCAAAEREGIPVGLYGGRPERMGALIAELEHRFPKLPIVYQHSPPFRPLTEKEKGEVIDGVSASGARILFVGLGCPKQEIWMADHRGKIPAVMLGVGAAFDFHAGHVLQAPAFVQAAGLEWAFRLAMEPRRLWRRYTRVVPTFSWRLARQLTLRTEAGH